MELVCDITPYIEDLSILLQNRSEIWYKLYDEPLVQRWPNIDIFETVISFNQIVSIL